MNRCKASVVTTNPGGTGRPGGDHLPKMSRLAPDARQILRRTVPNGIVNTPAGSARSRVFITIILTMAAPKRHVMPGWP